MKCCVSSSVTTAFKELASSAHTGTCQFFHKADIEAYLKRNLT